jgi:hypothetical protein
MRPDTKSRAREGENIQVVEKQVFTLVLVENKFKIPPILSLDIQFVQPIDCNNDWVLAGYYLWHTARRT